MKFVCNLSWITYTSYRMKSKPLNPEPLIFQINFMPLICICTIIKLALLNLVPFKVIHSIVLQFKIKVTEFIFELNNKVILEMVQLLFWITTCWLDLKLVFSNPCSRKWSHTVVIRTLMFESNIVSSSNVIFCIGKNYHHLILKIRSIVLRICAI